MSSSALRALQLLELISEGPIRQAELARKIGADHGGVSRTLAAMETEGWVVRLGGFYRLGARAAAFGSPVDQLDFVHRADEFARLLSGVTTVACMVLQLHGSAVSGVAATTPPRYQVLTEADGPIDRAWLTAGGVALLAQVPREDVEAMVADDEWPQITPSTPADASAVVSLIDAARAGAIVTENGWTIPGCACIALPWPDAARWAPTSIALVGFQADLDSNAELFESVLRAAVAPDATTSDIIRAAASQT